MSSRIIKSAIALLMALSLSALCACGDGSFSDEELAALEDEASWQLRDVEMSPVDDPDLATCEPGWDGCPELE